MIDHWILASKKEGHNDHNKRKVKIQQRPSHFSKARDDDVVIGIAICHAPNALHETGHTTKEKTFDQSVGHTWTMEYMAISVYSWTFLFFALRISKNHIKPYQTHIKKK